MIRINLETILWVRKTNIHVMETKINQEASLEMTHKDLDRVVQLLKMNKINSNHSKT